MQITTYTCDKCGNQSTLESTRSIDCDSGRNLFCTGDLCHDCEISFFAYLQAWEVESE